MHERLRPIAVRSAARSAVANQSGTQVVEHHPSPIERRTGHGYYKFRLGEGIVFVPYGLSPIAK
jgi:hypothetical protein